MLESQRTRAPGATRLLGMLALLAGIVAMHSAVFLACAHAHSPGRPAVAAMSDTGAPTGFSLALLADSPGSMASTELGVSPGHPLYHEARQAAPAAMPVTHVASIDRAVGMDPTPDGCGGSHASLHGCVFVLAAVAALFGLIMLYRMAFDRPGSGGALARHWRPRRERPPPWTVHTLAELAILRI